MPQATVIRRTLTRLPGICWNAQTGELGVRLPYVFAQPSFETFQTLRTDWCLSSRCRFLTERIRASGSTHDGYHSC